VFQDAQLKVDFLNSELIIESIEMIDTWAQFDFHDVQLQQGRCEIQRRFIMGVSNWTFK
jgi:hypothetical protein